MVCDKFSDLFAFKIGSFKRSKSVQNVEAVFVDFRFDFGRTVASPVVHVERGGELFWDRRKNFGNFMLGSRLSR